jgi:diguanylate cyclase (GGDEF)-like protein
VLHRDALRVADFLLAASSARIRMLEAENQALRESNEMLRAELVTDSLTGALNERGIRKSIEQRKSESGLGFVIMYLDANRFKDVNDRYTHDGGDFVIKEIEKYLRGRFRKNDGVMRLQHGRMHGDEFVVVFADTTEEKLMATFEGDDKKLAFVTHYTTSDGRFDEDISVSLSAGIAAPKDGESLEDTLRRADEAIYVSKQTRDGSVARYSEKK